MKFQIYWCRNILIIFWILHYPLFSYGSTDSLLLLIKNSGENAELVNLYHELIEITDKDSLKISYAKEAIALSKRVRDPESIYESQLKLGIVYYSARQYANTLKVWKEIEETIDQLDRPKGNLSLLKSKNSFSEAQCLAWLQQYYESVVAATKSLELLEQTNSDSIYHKGDVHITIGWVYEKLASYDLAEQNYRIAEDIFRDHNQFENLIIVINNISQIRLQTNKFQESIDKDKLIQSILDTVYTDDFKMRDFILANSKYRTGYCYTKLKNNKEAKFYLKAAKKTYQKLKDDLYEAYCDLFLERISFDKNRTATSVDKIKAIDQLAIQSKDLELQRYCSEELAYVYEKLGNTKASLSAYKRAVHMNDSIANVELLLKLRSTELNSRFNIEKEKELLNTRLESEQKRTYLLKLFLALMAIAGLILTYSFRTTYKLKNSLQQTNKELQKSEQQQMIINEDLQRHINLNLELEQFAYIASHDIKAPLRTINSFAGLLKKRFLKTADEMTLTYFEFIIKGASSLNLMVDDLLAFAKTNTQSLNISEFYFSKVLDEVRQNLDFSLSKVKGEIITENKDVVLYADKIKVKQILQNIFSNALKFVDDSRKPIIKISIVENSEFVEIQVKDNGVGIPEDKYEEVFKKFSRLHSKDQFEGTGLGLSICKKYVDLHGGKIWINRNEDHGVTMKFTLAKNIELVK